MITFECTKCGVVKPEDNFKWSTERGKPRRRKQCNACMSRYQVEYQKKNSDRRKKKDRAYHLRKVHGLTLADYDALMEKQLGVCAICGQASGDNTGRRLHVDHCHSTGAIRGLLCNGCNRGLGYFSDRADLLRAAAEYLERGCD